MSGPGRCWWGAGVPRAGPLCTEHVAARGSEVLGQRVPGVPGVPGAGVPGQLPLQRVCASVFAR